MAGGGFNVGWLRVGEWMKYTIDVTEIGECRRAQRVHVSLDIKNDNLLFDLAELCREVLKCF